MCSPLFFYSTMVYIILVLILTATGKLTIDNGTIESTNYGNVYVYEGAAGGVVTNAEDCLPTTGAVELSNSNTILVKMDSDKGQITCKGNITINLLKRNLPATIDSISSEYLVIISTNQTSANGHVTIPHQSVTCWDGEVWEAKAGAVSSDQKYICCSGNVTSVQQSCSKLIVIDKYQFLTKESGKIKTGYGFMLNYTISSSVLHQVKNNLQVSLECGEYKCEFIGTSRTSGDCFMGNITQQSSPNLQLIVPYLTSQFRDVTQCIVQFLLVVANSSVVLVTSVVEVELINSTLIVSSYSDTGLLDLPLLFLEKDPICAGDGWPAPLSSHWVFQEKYEGMNKFKIIKWDEDGWGYTKAKKGGNKYKCVVEGATGQNVSRWMMFVDYFYDGGLSNMVEVSLSYKNETKELSCGTNLGYWEPPPTEFGWRAPDGTDHEVSVDTEFQDEVTWSFTISTPGEYACWVKVHSTWSNISEQATFRKDHVVTAYGHYSSQTTTLSQNMTTEGLGLSTKLTNASFKPNSTGQDNEKSSFNYLYLIGLGVLAVIIIVSTALSYKVVRKNQVKVSNLDTKISLEKVKSNMGFNALYSQARETDPLIAAVKQISKADLTTDVVIGTGQFGKVLKASLKSRDEEGVESERDVAVKYLTSVDPEESSLEFLKEVCMMYKFDHPNVLKLLGICAGCDHRMIISEYMGHGNLRDYLMNKDMFFTLRDKLYIAYQVACGLDHIASQQVVHRDIAARNCLVGPNLLVKVADFGLSRSVAMSEYYKKAGGHVPIRWMSPESIKYGRYTHESDVWAFGVLMWEVYTEGHFPYSGYSNEEVQNMVNNGFKLHVPPHCTEEITVLMQATWETEPADRPSFKSLRTRLNLMRNSDIASNLLYSAPLPHSSSTPLPHHVPCHVTRDDQITCAEGTSTPDLASNRYTREPGVTMETAL